MTKVRLVAALEADGVWRMADLTLPLQPGAPGVEASVRTQLPADTFTSCTWTLSSHAGTHIDSPLHFLEGGATVELTPLTSLIGPAQVLDVTSVTPGEAVQVEHLASHSDRLQPQGRVLLKSNWSERAGEDDYRTGFSPLSLSSVQWLVAQQQVLIGVETPSVGDLQSPDRLSEVHRVLLRSGVVIVESLANLALLPDEVVVVILPLPLVGSDGSPVRAVGLMPEEGP